jgi:hypothetical protein
MKTITEKEWLAEFDRVVRENTELRNPYTPIEIQTVKAAIKHKLGPTTMVKKWKQVTGNTRSFNSIRYLYSRVRAGSC